MRKIYIALFSIGFAALPSLTYAEDHMTTLKVAVHICGESISTIEELNEITDFKELVELCPVIEQNEDKSESMFDLIVRNNGEAIDASATEESICKKDDCIEIPYYEYSDIEGSVTIVEKDQSEDVEFGTVKFVPSEWSENNDSESLVAYGGGVVNLESSEDDDNTIALHVFNFSSSTDEDLEEALKESESPKEYGLAEDEDMEETNTDKILSSLEGMIDSLVEKIDNLIAR